MSGAAATIALPSMAVTSNGDSLEIVNFGTNAWAVARPSGDTCNIFYGNGSAGTSFVLNPGSSVTLLSDGSNWVVVNFAPYAGSSLSFNDAQSLSAAQKAQAFSNLGFGGIAYDCNPRVNNGSAGSAFSGVAAEYREQNGMVDAWLRWTLANVGSATGVNVMVPFNTMYETVMFGAEFNVNGQELQARSGAGTNDFGVTTFNNGGTNYMQNGMKVVMHCRYRRQ